MKIGIIREGKNPPDKRVALTPEQCAQIKQHYSHVDIIVEPSAIRCFSDEEYKQAGIELSDAMHTCDILIGIKEVPVEQLIADKTYFFFSHTIKKQAYNRKLLCAILEKRIRMVDHETLTDKYGNRLIAFGYYAGLVGAYNGLMAYGAGSNRYHLKRAWQCKDKAEMFTTLKETPFPPMRVAVTGGGRVSSGAIDTLTQAGFKRLSPEEYLRLGEAAEPVYTQLNSVHYHRHREGKNFESSHFYQYPEAYESTFWPFCTCTDLLVAAAYWNPAAPVLFTKEQMRHPAFSIRTIADVTCDIEGSIPSTSRASTIAEPVYDYNPYTEKEEAPYSSTKNIHVMAIDNLPGELPRDASGHFGDMFLSRILPALLNGDTEKIIERATIAENGTLKPRYAYLSDFVQGHPTMEPKLI